MATVKKNNYDKIAKILGASREINLKGRKTAGPLDWINLVHIVQNCLISRGGRPSNPHWDTKRLVPFRTKTWKNLLQKTKVISSHGRKVGPAQLAAIMIEEYLDPSKGTTRFYVQGLEKSSESSPNAVAEEKQTFPPVSLHMNEITSDPKKSVNTRYYSFTKEGV